MSNIKMFSKATILATFLVCISAQHQESPSYSTYGRLEGDEHRNYHQPATAVIKPSHVAPALLKVPSATYQSAPSLIKAEINTQHATTPTEQADHHQEYPDAHPRYDFEYSVNDKETHDIHNQHEERDGHVVKGVYSLLQPDGVTRTVHYTADKEGFNAQVEYSGHADHPQEAQKSIQISPIHHQQIPASVQHQVLPAHHQLAVSVNHQPIPVNNQQTIEAIPVNHQEVNVAGNLQQVVAAIPVHHQEVPAAMSAHLQHVPAQGQRQEKHFQLQHQQALEASQGYAQQVSSLIPGQVVKAVPVQHQHISAQIQHQQTVDAIPVQHQQITAQVHHQQAVEAIPVQHQQITAQVHHQQAVEAIPVQHQQITAQVHHQQAVEAIPVQHQQIAAQVHHQQALETIPVHNQHDTQQLVPAQIHHEQAVEANEVQHQVPIQIQHQQAVSVHHQQVPYHQEARAQVHLPQLPPPVHQTYPSH